MTKATPATPDAQPAKGTIKSNYEDMTDLVFQAHRETGLSEETLLQILSITMNAAYADAQRGNYGNSQPEPATSTD